MRGLNEKHNNLNYGRVMHEAFENIITADDVESSVNKLVAEGKVSSAEKGLLEMKLKDALKNPVACEWFKPGLKIMNEAELLLPGGKMKRPDRVIIDNGKAIIIDFKFGEESSGNLSQVRQYRNLLSEMGYTGCEAYLWYLETNKIITV
jgi:hypothetical protein